MSRDEKIIWQGRPSQFMNIHLYAVCLALFLWLVYTYWGIDNNMLLIAVVPCILAGYRYLSTKVMQYTLTSEEFIYKFGLLSPQEQPLELYKILDRVPLKPWYMRMFGLGDVLLDTMDESTPKLLIRAVYEPMQVADVIRHHAEKMKEIRGFRTFNVQSA